MYPLVQREGKHITEKSKEDLSPKRTSVIYRV